MDLRSHDFSTIGIATGTTVPDDLQSCAIDIPANLATGSRELQVIAYGIASDPALCRSPRIRAYCSSARPLRSKMRSITTRSS